MERNILIGIDLGTTSLRAVFYDCLGNNYGVSEVKIETYHPRKDYAEQKPQDWINALKNAIHSGMKDNNIQKEQILAMSIASTCCTAIFAKKDGTILHDAIMWMDTRSSKQADEIYEISNERLSCEWMPCKLLWLKQNDKKLYDEAEIFCECQDYLTYYLTGIWSINNNTACNWGYNIDKNSFPIDFYEKIGLKDALNKFPDEHVYVVGDKIGNLLPDVAKDLGLLEDTIVAQGGIDSSIGILGMGVYKEGRLALMTGSSNLTMLLTKKPMFSESTINVGPSHLINGYYTSFRATLCSNMIIEWFRKEVVNDLSDEFFDKFELLLNDTKVGSDGLLLLDYFLGNKQPYYDNKVKGMIYGLSPTTSIGNFYRCILEGIAYGTRNLIEQYRKSGFEVNEINMSGGTCNSKIFSQIMADVCNVAINIPLEKRTVALGCAISCTKACNIYPSLQVGVEKMVRYKNTIYPIKENVVKYQKLFEKYNELYPLMADWMHSLADLNI